MNLKRIVIGICLISASFLLLFPLKNYEIINWLGAVKNLLFGLIPVLLIGYGLLKLKDSLSEIGLEIGGVDEGGEEVSPQEFETSSNWSTDEKWHGLGTDLWQGEIKDGNFMMKEGAESSHYAKKFKDVKFNTITIDLELPESGEYETFMELATGESRDGIDTLNPDEFEKSKRVELEGGKSKIETDFDWEEFAFMKIVLHRKEKGFKSPMIKYVETEG